MADDHVCGADQSERATRVIDFDHDDAGSMETKKRGGLLLMDDRPNIVSAPDETVACDENEESDLLRFSYRVARVDDGKSTLDRPPALRLEVASSKTSMDGARKRLRPATERLNR